MQQNPSNNLKLKDRDMCERCWVDKEYRDALNYIDAMYAVYHKGKILYDFVECCGSAVPGWYYILEQIRCSTGWIIFLSLL